jgi:hypothetical protein
MARRSLRPELNRIRAWVQQGRTDAWIAHQLEVTVQQIQAFKRDQKLEASDEAEGNGTTRDFDDDIDLRAEDDALIAAELDAAAAESTESDDDDDEDEDDKPSRRRRSRRGGRGRGRRRTSGPLEATFDHGEGHRPVEVAIEEDQIVIRRAGSIGDGDGDGDEDDDE